MDSEPDSDVAPVDSEAALSEDEALARARREPGALPGPPDDEGSGRGGRGYEDLGAPLCVVGSLQRSSVAHRHSYTRAAFAR